MALALLLVHTVVVGFDYNFLIVGVEPLELAMLLEAPVDVYAGRRNS